MRLFLAFVVLGSMTGIAAQAQVDSNALRARIEAGHAVGRITAGGSAIRARKALTDFYLGRGYAPVWTQPRLADLRAGVASALSHGLESSDYPVPGAASEPVSVDTELLATDAFLMLGSHLLHGRVNPESLEAEWTANRRSTDMAAVLNDALARGDIAGSLQALAPTQPRYARLREQLSLLREHSAEDWTPIADGGKLEEGADGSRVAALRSRLFSLGDLPLDSGSTEFDSALTSAVVQFQARHGLENDGVVGPATLKMLNRPPVERIRQITANMERWRWLPADLGTHHIEVNIAGFDVKVMKNGQMQRRHRAIVGRAYRETPMFTGIMTYLVLAPYWNVPPTIAANDKLPAIKRNPSYVAAQKMTLFDQASNKPVDPRTVDWTGITGSSFNRQYRLRQEPGPHNALGNVKFMFPNQHNVYLHDTPSRELFSRATRNFSSGCIRVEDPLDLALYLLGDDPSWTRKRIDDVVAGGKEQSVKLAETIPVHLLYWTTWVDEDGVVQHREDIYGRDLKVLQALAEKPRSR